MRYRLKVDSETGSVVQEEWHKVPMIKSHGILYVHSWEASETFLKRIILPGNGNLHIVAANRFANVCKALYLLVKGEIQHEER